MKSKLYSNIKAQDETISRSNQNLMQEHLLLDETWDLNNDAYFGNNLERVEGDIHVLVECPPKPDQVDLMPPIDEGWTARWLSDFRKSQIASHNLPLVGELDEFIKHELPVKITLHERIQKSWISKMKTPSYEVMDKIFRVANSEPCVELLNQIGYRVVVAVHPGDTEYFVRLVLGRLDLPRIELRRHRQERSKFKSTSINRIKSPRLTIHCGFCVRLSW